MTLCFAGDFAIVRLFPSSPEPKAGSTQRKSRLAGEIISLLTSKEIKDFKKAGEWCVHCSFARYSWTESLIGPKALGRVLPSRRPPGRTRLRT